MNFIFNINLFITLLFFLFIIDIFYFIIINNFTTFFLRTGCDAPYLGQITTQDPATDIFEGMVNLYDLLCFELIIIVSIILVLLGSILFDSQHHSNSQTTFAHSTELEVFWTIVPALLLLTLAYPSFTLLYALDDLTLPNVTIKVIGHQWYWSYEYLIDQNNELYTFDSYMVNSAELEEGEFRLLEVDNRLILPVNKHIRLLITSADVLHSWAVPSFGIKVDACPGRLNQASLLIKRVGTYFGQCSEICGINHGFMPIVVSAYKDFPSN
jgi:cytochrome c oxidase subunit 2